MRAILLILALLLSSQNDLRADLGNPSGIDLGVKAGAKAVSSDDIAFTPKSGYIHMIFNAAPYPAVTGKNRAALSRVVLRLIETEGHRAYPDSNLFKVDVADVSVRDDYGLPAWDKIKLIQRFVVKATKKGFQIETVKKP